MATQLFAIRLSKIGSDVLFCGSADGFKALFTMPQRNYNGRKYRSKSSYNLKLLFAK
jgi:hypothetical protein